MCAIGTPGQKGGHSGLKVDCRGDKYKNKSCGKGVITVVQGLSKTKGVGINREVIRSAQAENMVCRTH